jgi:frataxin-like iron-binding protein CyaY
MITLDQSIINDPERLASAIEMYGLPSHPREGRRVLSGSLTGKLVHPRNPMSKTGITRLRRLRAKGREIEATTLEARLHAYLIALYVPEIEAAGGEIVIVDQHSTHRLAVADRAHGSTLLRAEGRRWYSHRSGSSLATLAYVCFRMPGGKPEVFRVPGYMKTMREADSWLRFRQPLKMGRRPSGR